MGQQVSRKTGILNLLLHNILTKNPATYYNSCNDHDHQWELLLHLFLAEFGRGAGQVVTQLFKTVHELFLKWHTVLGWWPK